MKLFDDIKATLGMGDNVTGPAGDAPAQTGGANYYWMGGGRRRTHRRRRGRKCRGGEGVDPVFKAAVDSTQGGGRRRRRGSRKSRRGSRKHTRRHRR